MTVGSMPLPGKGRPGPTAVPWVSAMVYGIVLAAGLYYSAMGLGSGDGMRIAGFVAVMTALFGMEAAQQRWLAPGGRQWPVVALLAARLGLFVAAAALDPSGESRALFVLVPFAAYFAFGRAASLALAALCLVLLVVSIALRVPHWYTEATYLSDVLMFGVGLVLAIAMANVAVGEQASRARLEQTLRDLEESHVQLTASSAQVAELSAEAERNRLARDIHDSLGHHLTAITVQLEKAAAFRDRDRATAEQALADARSSARQALDDVRLSVRALRGDQPPARLTTMLADLVRQAAGQQQVTLTVTGDEGSISAAARAVLYRSAQEALTNARRHSGAREITVLAAFRDHDTRLVSPTTAAASTWGGTKTDRTTGRRAARVSACSACASGQHWRAGGWRSTAGPAAELPSPLPSPGSHPSARQWPPASQYRRERPSERARRGER